MQTEDKNGGGLEMSLQRNLCWVVFLILRATRGLIPSDGWLYAVVSFASKRNMTISEIAEAISISQNLFFTKSLSGYAVSKWKHVGI